MLTFVVESEMDLSSAKLVEVLRATLNPDLRANAEKQLEGVSYCCP